jgi:glycosyltransferase involved in cell wall biosynthesis
MAHANDIFERGLLLPRKALRAKKLLTISEHNRRYLEQLGVASGKLAVVRCGVSFAAAPVLPKPSFRSRYRIGTLGRLVEKKGMDVLLRAIAELRQKPYAIELAVAGDGPMHAELAALAASLGLGEIVRFEGSLSHSQVATWMRSLDLFVLACKADSNGDMDGIPVVLMEAMSQSIPVVSTRLSGIPELIRHEETGLLAQPGDPLDLANQIDRLLAFPELRQRLAVHAVAHVEAEFGRNVNLDRLLECFDLGGKPTICQTM